MGQYKAKDCPTCGTTHNKRGPYCSRSCGNHRQYTNTQKQAKSKAMREHMAGDSDSANLSKWIIAEKGRFHRESIADPNAPKASERDPNDYNVLPNTRIERGQFVADGALWTEADQ